MTRPVSPQRAAGHADVRLATHGELTPLRIACRGNGTDTLDLRLVVYKGVQAT